MKRIVFNDLEQVIIEDLNDAQRILFKTIYDQVLYRLFKGQDGFLDTGFQVTRASSTTLTVKAGRGFFYDSSQDGQEPKFRAIDLDSDQTLTIGSGSWAAAPSSPNNRYDIVVVRPIEEVTFQELRNQKTESGGSIEEVLLDKVSEQTYELDVVEGTADPSPAVPSTPAGWTKIAEVYVTGGSNIANAYDVSDVRSVFQFKRTFEENQSISSAHNISLDECGKTFYVDTSGGAVAFLLPPAKEGFSFGIKDLGSAATHNITLTRQNSEQIEGVAGTYTMSTNRGFWKFTCRSGNWFLTGKV